MPALLLLLAVLTFPAVRPAWPPPPGRLIDLGGQRLHLYCTGRGTPTVVVENGLGSFATDWIFVQHGVATFSRICTYDRAGYAWSDPGPLPRTFAQLNLELREALARAGERGPYVLVGHSFGGGVIRAFAMEYSDDVAGLVFVDAVSEHQYIRMGTHAGRVGDDAKGRAFPEVRLGVPVEGSRTRRPPSEVVTSRGIEPPYDRLPPRERRLHLWAAAQPALQPAEDSQREWSAESFARWAATGSRGSLGARPLIVLTRASGGYDDDLDVPAVDMERVRIEAQAGLAGLSTAGVRWVVKSGHEMHLEAPRVVTAAIRQIVDAVRQRSGGMLGPTGKAAMTRE